MRHIFPKSEHLCLKRDIEALFTPQSHSHSAFPLRMLVREVPYNEGEKRVKMLVSVSKRKFKHAVDRNRAKRQVREAYRLHKHELIDRLPPDVALHIAFVWMADAPQESRLVHKRLNILLQRIADRFAAPSSQ